MSENEENSPTISELDDHQQDTPASVETDAPVEEVKAALAAKTEEAQALHERYLRLAAEFDNYRKLSQRDMREASRFANEGMLRELLPIVDNLERAVKAAQGTANGEGLVRGVELTLKQFGETLAKFGVRPVASVGDPFDPTCHQAVARVERPDVPENQVIEEFQKGYLLHDRILRAAMVSVAGAPAGGTAPADTQRTEE
jgi:molecular chaperone GrpE